MNVLAKTLIGSLAVLLAAAAALLAPSTGQAADYPAPTFSASLEDQVVFSGENVIVDAQANIPANWDIGFNGENRTGTGPKFTATFVAPQVSRTTWYDVPVHAEAVTSTARGPATFDKTLRVKVLPRNSQAGPSSNGVLPNVDALPNTGGPNLYLLLGALLLLLAGLGSVMAARRTSNSD